LRGEIYLKTAEGIIIRMGDQTTLNYNYNSKTGKAQILVDKGNVGIYNPDISLTIEYPYLSLYSQGGVFTQSVTDGRLDIYNYKGDLRLLPGISNLTPLVDAANEKPERSDNKPA
jgi:hypothetical protein